MKKQTLDISYWVCTIAFAGLMIYSSVGGIGPNQQTTDIFHHYLGYPVYFIRFISWAKIVGSVTLLIPGLKRVKEWAYAGLFFDLGAAVFSVIAVSGTFDPGMLTMLIWIVPGILSYYFWTIKSAS